MQRACPLFFSDQGNGRKIRAPWRQHAGQSACSCAVTRVCDTAPEIDVGDSAQILRRDVGKGSMTLENGSRPYGDAGPVNVAVTKAQSILTASGRRPWFLPNYAHHRCFPHPSPPDDFASIYQQAKITDMLLPIATAAMLLLLKAMASQTSVDDRCQLEAARLYVQAVASRNTADAASVPLDEHVHRYECVPAPLL